MRPDAELTPIQKLESFWKTIPFKKDGEYDVFNSKATNLSEFLNGLSAKQDELLNLKEVYRTNKEQLLRDDLLVGLMNYITECQTEVDSEWKDFAQAVSTEYKSRQQADHRVEASSPGSTPTSPSQSYGDVLQSFTQEFSQDGTSFKLDFGNIDQTVTLAKEKLSQEPIEEFLKQIKRKHSLEAGASAYEYLKAAGVLEEVKLIKEGKGFAKSYSRAELIAKGKYSNKADYLIKALNRYILAAPEICGEKTLNVTNFENLKTNLNYFIGQAKELSVSRELTAGQKEKLQLLTKTFDAVALEMEKERVAQQQRADQQERVAQQQRADQQERADAQPEEVGEKGNSANRPEFQQRPPVETIKERSELSEEQDLRDLTTVQQADEEVSVKSIGADIEPEVEYKPFEVYLNAVKEGNEANFQLITTEEIEAFESGLKKLAADIKKRKTNGEDINAYIEIIRSAQAILLDAKQSQEPEVSEVSEEDPMEEPNKFADVVGNYVLQRLEGNEPSIDFTSLVKTQADIELMEDALEQSLQVIEDEIGIESPEYSEVFSSVDQLSDELENLRPQLSRIPNTVVEQDGASQDQGRAISDGYSEIDEEEVDPISKFDTSEIRSVFTTEANRVKKQIDAGELTEAKANEAAGMILTVVPDGKNFKVIDADSNELPVISALFDAASKHKEFKGLGTDLTYIAEEEFGLTIDFLKGDENRFCISYMDSEGQEHLLNKDGVAAYEAAIDAKFQAEELARQAAEEQRLAEAEAQRLAEEKAQNIAETIDLLSTEENKDIQQVALANIITAAALQEQLKTVDNFSNKEQVLQDSINAILQTINSSLEAEFRELEAARSLDVNSYQHDTYSATIEGLEVFDRSKYTSPEQNTAITPKILAITKTKAEFDKRLAAYSAKKGEFEAIDATYQNDQWLQGATYNFLKEKEGGKSSLSFYEIPAEVIKELQATNQATSERMKKAEARFEALNAGPFKIINSSEEFLVSNVEKFQLYGGVITTVKGELRSPYLVGQSTLKEEYEQVQRIAQTQMGVIQEEATKSLDALTAQMHRDIDLTDLTFSNNIARNRAKAKHNSIVDGFTDKNAESIKRLEAILGKETVSQSITEAQAALKENIEKAYDPAKITSPVRSSGTPTSSLGTRSSLRTGAFTPNMPVSVLEPGQPKLSLKEKLAMRKQAALQSGGNREDRASSDQSQRFNSPFQLGSSAFSSPELDKSSGEMTLKEKLAMRKMRKQAALQSDGNSEDRKVFAGFSSTSDRQQVYNSEFQPQSISLTSRDEREQSSGEMTLKEKLAMRKMRKQAALQSDGNSEDRQVFGGFSSTSDRQQEYNSEFQQRTSLFSSAEHGQSSGEEFRKQKLAEPRSAKVLSRSHVDQVESRRQNTSSSKGGWEL